MSTVQNPRPPAVATVRRPSPRPIALADLWAILASFIDLGLMFAPRLFEVLDTVDGWPPAATIRMPDGDTASVDWLAGQLELGTPSASSWVTTRNLERRRCYGTAPILRASSMRLYAGWAIDVHCLVPEDHGRTVGTAHVPLVELVDDGQAPATLTAPAAAPQVAAVAL